MAGRLFGTDGVRGAANVDLTAELTLDLAVAAAHVLTEYTDFRSHGHARPVAVVGRDPRVSGEFLEAVLVGGLASAGVDVCVVGVVPTPGVAFLTRDLDADFGVIISASHNAMPDNGIKFFARGGHKLPDEVEDAIEARMAEDWERPTGADVGRITDGRPLRERYLEHLVAVCPNRLEGLTVVVDAAHGAASEVAPEAYRRMGATVIAINAAPDGYNINDGVGSTHMEGLQRAVVEHGADLGIAHDGDADRCLAVAADGALVDGDQIMAILALRMAADGSLVDNTLVATVMSNLGLKLAMQAQGITVVTADVGDRYVLAEMQANGYNLGGEQSGHIVPMDHSTTGDGTLTALLIMSAMANSGKPLAELASVVTVLPQVLVNVKGVDKNAVGGNAAVAAAVAEAEAELQGTGRVLLRKSGTEPLVRVMVEAGTQEQADEIAHRLADVVRAELALD